MLGSNRSVSILAKLWAFVKTCLECHLVDEIFLTMVNETYISMVSLHIISMPHITTYIIQIGNVLPYRAGAKPIKKIYS